MTVLEIRIMFERCRAYLLVLDVWIARKWTFIFITQDFPRSLVWKSTHYTLNGYSKCLSMLASRVLLAGLRCVSSTKPLETVARFSSVDIARLELIGVHRFVNVHAALKIFLVNTCYILIRQLTIVFVIPSPLFVTSLKSWLSTENTKGVDMWVLWRDMLYMCVAVPHIHDKSIKITTYRLFEGVIGPSSHLSGIVSEVVEVRTALFIILEI